MPCLDAHPPTVATARQLAVPDVQYIKNLGDIPESELRQRLQDVADNSFISLGKLLELAAEADITFPRFSASHL